jgi:hypothetical protein
MSEQLKLSSLSYLYICHYDAVSVEKLIVPEDTIPVAAVIAPEELTWNPEPDPTDNKRQWISCSNSNIAIRQTDKDLKQNSPSK